LHWRRCADLEFCKLVDDCHDFRTLHVDDSRRHEHDESG
jgi:hypothetical protein